MPEPSEAAALLIIFFTSPSMTIPNTHMDITHSFDNEGDQFRLFFYDKER